MLKQPINSTYHIKINKKLPNFLNGKRLKKKLIMFYFQLKKNSRKNLLGAIIVGNVRSYFLGPTPFLDTLKIAINYKQVSILMDLLHLQFNIYPHIQNRM